MINSFRSIVAVGDQFLRLIIEFISGFEARRHAAPPPAMAAYFTSSDVTDHQFEPASYDGLKLATSLPFVSKPAAVAVATVLAAPPARAANAPNADEAEAENDKLWDFVDSRACATSMRNKEEKLHVKRVKAKKALKKALKNCTGDVPERQRAYDKAKKAYFQYLDKVKKAYASHLRESAREYESDADYTPSQSDAEEEPAEAEADAYYAPSDAEEPAEVEDDAPAPKKNSKRKHSGPAAGPVKKAPRAKPGSKPQKPLPNGCGCSCGGVRCGHATETPVIRYDKTTQRQCCNTCGIQQNKAMNFEHGDGVAANESSTRSLCWLNQCDDVRLHGFGVGHQGKNRKAAAAAAVASVDEEDEE